MTTTAIYCRISSDPQGLRAGVDRQEQDCRAYADRLGWSVGEVFVDNDVSAYSGKPRPAYGRMLAALEAGTVDAVVAWHNDRLHRSPLELEGFIAVIERAGAAVAVVEGGTYDLTSPDGRLAARIVGAVARKESEDKARRLRRKHLELAQAGRASGGGDTRPFAFEDDQVTVVEHEAAMVREAAEAVLAGRTLRSLVAEWNAQGRTTTSGRSWYPSALRRILVGARWAGYREHQGKQYPAVWPAILPRDTHLALRALLQDPARRTAGRPRSYLLSGIVVCGKCDRTLNVQPRRGVPGYDCVKDRGGCGGTHIMAEPLDAMVVERVIELAAAASLAGAPAGTDAGPAGPDPALVAELDALDARLERAQGFLVDGTLTRDEYLRLRTETEQRQEQVRATMAEHMPAPSSPAWRAAVAKGLGAPVGDEEAAWAETLAAELETWRQEWEELDLDQQRAEVRRWLATVRVGPAVKGRARFDPDRVKIDPAWG